MSETIPALSHGKRYLTVRQAALAYPAMTESSLRWLRFNGDQNGFNTCVLTVGRKVLIDADALERWLDTDVPPRFERFSCENSGIS